MSIEVTCPACGGSIQIEEVSEIVACPLCEVHLQIDPETSEPTLVTAEEETEADPGVTAENSSTEAAENETASPTEAAPAEPTDAASEASPFSFLPGGNQQKSREERSTPKFSFLPGGDDESKEAEPETPAVEETSTDTPAPSSEETTEETSEIAPEAPATESEEKTPFSFLPDQKEVDSSTAATEKPATNFSFLPGGSEEAASPAEDTAKPEEAEAASEESNQTDNPETVAADESDDTTAATAETETSNEQESTEEVAAESTSSAAVADETASEPESPSETAPAETNTDTTEPAVAPAPPQSYRKEKVVPRRLFTLTLTYAIAATIMVALLLYAKYQGDPHQLESLPDLKPPIKNDEIALQLVPENASLPPGHTLQLGGPGRRFGNVMVTPLRVTRSPLEFEHYTGDSSKTRAPSEDVLKLYLKFENVSDDQTFEPLDQKLLLTRVSGNSPDVPLRANNFVCRVDQKRPDGQRVLVYDMPPSWEWNLKGQNINREQTPQNLAPGESFETYVATDEQGIDALKGDLVWRLQIRKGYNPKSHRGVTTLIDIVFNSDQIQSEGSSQSNAALPTS